MYDLSVIIVTYNTCTMTRACLTALAQAAAGIPHEIIVVDNASADGTAEMIRKDFPAAILIANPRNLGFGAANNQAFLRAMGKYILLLNSDTVLPADALHILLAEAISSPRLGALGCRLLNTDGSLQRSCWRFPTLLNTALETFGLSRIARHAQNYQEWDYNSRRSVDFVIGACLLIPRTTLDAIGGFDERFFLYAEETDLCWRMHRAGYQVVYTPATSVTHIGGASSAHVSEQRQNEFQRSKDLLMSKYYSLPGVVLYKVLMLIGALIRLCAFGGVYLPIRTLRPAILPALNKKIETYAHAMRWTLGLRRPGYLSTLDNR